MTHPDFSDGATLVPGDIHGIRVFNIDNYGRLRGLHFTSVFEPGENQAACEQGNFGRSCRNSNNVPAKDCSCGFYAYHSHRHAKKHVSAASFPIMALISSSGRCVVGEHGFRAGKAKLVGIAKPARSPLSVLKPFAMFGKRFASWIDSGSGPAMVVSFISGILSIFSLGIALIWSIVVLFSSEVWSNSITALYVGAFVVGGPLLCALLSEFAYHKCVAETKAYNDRFKLVVRNYPGVKVFKSPRKMQEAFTPFEYVAEVPTPESDEDFWKRDL